MMDPDGPQHETPYWRTTPTPADPLGDTRERLLVRVSLRCRDVLGLRSGRGSCFHPEGVQEKGGYGWVRARFAIPANGSSRLLMF